jgi:hypothetical protein
MGCNDDGAGGSSSNMYNNLTVEEVEVEVEVFTVHSMLIPVDWRLPTGWNISEGGFTI